jgi:hypothetical protein
LTETDRALLKRRVYAAVDELKSMGWNVERIIVRMKEVAAEVGVRGVSAWHPREETPVMEQAVRWCIERFYADKRD